MIDKREILETASALGLLPSIVEKDYALGWLLAGINAHPDLVDTWVFKGGTCLKGCYFETYRFASANARGEFRAARDSQRFRRAPLVSR